MKITMAISMGPRPTILLRPRPTWPRQSTQSWCMAWVCVWCTLGCWAAPPVSLLAAPPGPPGDPVERIQPMHARSIEQQDRIDAAAWAARGRIHQLREEPQEALICYQRAFVRDPTARTLLPDIALLATQQHHGELAVRYAALALDANIITEPKLQRQLAAVLVDEGEFERGAELYRSSVAKLDVHHLTWQDYVALFESARLAYLSNRPDEAVQTIQPVWTLLTTAAPPGESVEFQSLRQALLKETAQPLDLLIDVFLANKQPELAQQALELRNKHHPQPARRAYLQAEIDWLANHPDRARQSLDEYHQLGSSDAGLAPYRLLAQVIDPAATPQAPPSDRLLQQLEKWRDDLPEDLPLALFYAESLAKAGRPEDAQAVYRQVLSRQGVQEAYVGLLQQLIPAGSASDIVDLLIEYLSLSQSLELLNPAFKQLADDEAAVDRVLTEAQRRVDQKADSSMVVLVALALATTRDDDAATRHWLELADQRPVGLTSDILLQLGLDLIIAKRYALSDTVMEVGLRHAGPENRAEFYYYRCEALSQLQRQAEALEMSRLAVEHASPSLRPTVESRYGWLLYRAGRVEEAEQMLLGVTSGRPRRSSPPPADDGQPQPPASSEKADAAAQSDAPEAGSAEPVSEQPAVSQQAGPVSASDGLADPEAVTQARLVLGSIYAAQDRPADAEAQLIAVLMDDPEHVGALNDLAYLWADHGQRLARALQMLLTVVKAEPDNPAYRDSLGWCYYRLGRYGEAVEQLRQAAADPHPDGLILNHLGDALQQLGDLAGALDAWQRSVDRLTEPEQAEQRQMVAAKLEKFRHTSE